MRKLRHAVLLAASIAVLSGCDGGATHEATAEHHPEKAAKQSKVAAEDASPAPGEPLYISVTLAGRNGPDYAGIAMAYEHEWFDDPGVQVGVAAPLTPTRPIKYVLEGEDQVGVAHLPQVALARAKGLPIVAIGSVVSSPTAAMIWPAKSGIHGIADLRGKTVAIPGLSFQRSMLEGILTRAGVPPEDVKIVKAGNNLVPGLLAGRFDALFGGYGYVEGSLLEAHGLEPVVTPVTRLGVPRYEELVWITRKDFAAAHPAAIRGFLRAARRGTAAAVARPLAAAKILDRSGEKYLGLTPAAMAAGVKAVLPFLSRSGRMSRLKANRMLAWMHEEGMIQRQSPASAILLFPLGST